MCGRYTSTSTSEQVAAFFAAEEVKTEELPLRYNVAPSQLVYAIAERRRTDDQPHRQLGSFRWGLVPSWAKDPSIGNRMINARAETLSTRNAYKRALARHRCIIPADAFYEWQIRELEGRRQKAPYAIRHRDGSPLAFAGLWEVWHDAEDRPLRTCVIITTEANRLLAPIHDRMPVILPREAYERWLTPIEPDPRDLLVPYPDEPMTVWPISLRVNSHANDDATILERA